MKKNIFLVFCLTIILLINTNSYAISYSYEFYDTDAGGVASADMDISITGKTIYLILNNTSPTTLQNGSGQNSPGITKYGFDLLNFSSITLQTWKLEAFKRNGTNLTLLPDPVIIGADINPDPDIINPGPNNLNKWQMNIDKKINGITLDYMPGIYNGIDGALYNPQALYANNSIPNGNKTYFFTTAYLTMNFDAAPELSTSNVYVRMQNVGTGGTGSVKILNGKPVIPTPVVPEPGTMLMFGSILAGIAGFKIAKRKTKS